MMNPLTRQPWRAFFLSLLLCFGHETLANPWMNPPPLPVDYSQVDIYLATRDIGHEIYSKYGHTIIRVQDRLGRFDAAYNWGIFDFDDPNFVPRFLKGILIYHMGFGPWSDEVEISRDYAQTMWMERLRLTDRQKETLVKKIYWNAKPENIDYPYLFFYDNCSTRARDIIDEAIGGGVKRHSFTRKTGKTYRDRVMEYNASAPFFATAQDVILNSEPDREMTEWDDMFIPIKLRDYLREIPATDDSGQDIPGQRLLTDSKVITEYPQPDIPAINGYMMFWLGIGLPAITGRLLRRRHAESDAGLRLMGFSEVTLGSVWVFFSLFMGLSWIFGSHTVLPHNANLLLMSPLDAVYVISGVTRLRGQEVPSGSKLAVARRWVTYAHLIAATLLIAGSLSPVMTQDVSRIILWFIPLTALVIL